MEEEADSFFLLHLEAEAGEEGVLLLLLLLLLLLRVDLFLAGDSPWLKFSVVAVIVPCISSSSS